MAVPKRRTSKMKQKMRRGANRWRAPKLKTCPECESRVPSTFYSTLRKRDATAFRLFHIYPTHENRTRCNGR